MKFFPFLITSISPLLIVNAEFLMISSTLRLMYYGSVERTANDCYNSILLQLILQFKFPIQQIGLKRNFLRRVVQIIGSEIIQINDKVFPK